MAAPMPTAGITAEQRTSGIIAAGIIAVGITAANIGPKGQPLSWTSLQRTSGIIAAGIIAEGVVAAGSTRGPLVPRGP